MKDVVIQDKEIGLAHPPFIIAEMSGNHNQSLDRALQIIEAAASAGAHALKIQTYTADTMTLDLDDREFRIEDPQCLWKGKSLHKLYQEAHTPWEWHKPIFEKCNKLGLIAFSTPFDESAVDFLESLGAPCYKIASFENTDLPLIRKVAATGKPLIISGGMATEEELSDAVVTASQAGGKDLIILKCTSTYPADAKDANILTLPDMQRRFNCQVGLSDHILCNSVALASIALGARVIEKHFTLSRADGGVDSAFSLEPRELNELVVESQRIWHSLGKVCYGPNENEMRSLVFRRSLYVVKDMKAGDEFSKDNLRSIRPGLGLAPKYFDELIGKKVLTDVKKGTPISWGLIA